MPRTKARSNPAYNRPVQPLYKVERLVRAFRNGPNFGNNSNELTSNSRSVKMTLLKKVYTRLVSSNTYMQSGAILYRFRDIPRYKMMSSKNFIQNLGNLTRNVIDSVCWHISSNFRTSVDSVLSGLIRPENLDCIDLILSVPAIRQHG